MNHEKRNTENRFKWTLLKAGVWGGAVICCGLKAKGIVVLADANYRLMCCHYQVIIK